jgi:hypothetical protein
MRIQYDSTALDIWVLVRHQLCSTSTSAGFKYNIYSTEDSTVNPLAFSRPFSCRASAVHCSRRPAHPSSSSGCQTGLPCSPVVCWAVGVYLKGWSQQCCRLFLGEGRSCWCWQNDLGADLLTSDVHVIWRSLCPASYCCLTPCMGMWQLL